MKLTVWTYEGPPHVGAMRVATGMKGLHYVLHAPQGDTYADLLFTMIERRDHRPPVTYTTFQARDLGADLAEGAGAIALGGQTELPSDGFVDIHDVAGGQRHIDDPMQAGMQRFAPASTQGGLATARCS